MTDEHDEKARELLDDPNNFVRDPIAGPIPMHFNALYDVLATALRAAAGAREWQDIATAPKTSKAILVYVPSNRCTFTVTWRDGDRAGPSGWQIFGGGFRAFLSDPEGPSHWQPLPSPPATEQQREG